MNKKRIFIIGNGFDLHHYLETKYYHFKNFVKDFDEDLVKAIDDVFYDRGFYHGDIEYWSVLEEMLESLTDLDYDELYDDAFLDAEMDMDRASYWHDPEYNANRKAEEELLTPLKLKKYFDKWVDSIKLDDVNRDVNLDLSDNDLYINFNYTETLQDVYKIPDNKILHIHGKKHSEYVLGHNGTENIPYKDPYDTYEDSNGQMTSDADIRQVQVKEILNNSYSNLFHSYYKNSINLINKYRTWFDHFENADEVVIMGLSMGNEDAVYIREINSLMKHSCKIVVYYYDGLDKLKEKCKVLFIEKDIMFIKW